MTEEECDLKLVELIGAITDTCTALTEQTKAINALVESNQRLMMILADVQDDEAEEPMLTYLDGSPK